MNSHISKKQIPLLIPDMPNAEQLLPFLKQIDETRSYSNEGPLVQTLEARIADYFEVDRRLICVVTNATLGLLAAIKVYDDSCSRSIDLPSFTFTASASACLMSGSKSTFVDIDEDMRMLPSGFSDIVLDVLPFGAGLRQPNWYGNHRYAIIDAAASFDALHGFGRIFKPKTNVAIIVSLHATKMLGAGEGGIVYVNDPEIASKIRSFCNFGFDSRSGLRHSKSFGSNLKMSEYSAAVALASFSRWDEVRQDSIQRIGIARSISKRSGFSVHSAMDEGYANPYWIIRSGEEELIFSLLEKSREHKVDVRKWWGIGCHTMPAYSSIRRDKLPITERVGSRYLGLPFHRFLKTDDWNRIELFLGSI